MAKVTSQLSEAREQHAAYIAEMEDWDGKAQSLPEDAKPEEVQFIKDCFEAANRGAKRMVEAIERLELISESRKQIEVPAEDEAGESKEERRPAGHTRVTEERTYTVRSARNGVSFFGDIYQATRGEGDARRRLDKHASEMAVEQRAGLTTTANAGGGFVPPVYLGEMWAEFPRESRPFADALPSSPLMSNGMSITMPRITTGAATKVMVTENTTTTAGADMVEATITVPVRTLAGSQEVSQQLLDRSDPSIDGIIFNDLRASYDALLDTQLLSGIGSAGEHLGIRAVSSPNTVTFTTPVTAAAAVPKLYDGIQKIASNRYAPADLVIMHPRRAAWLASNLSSTFPLFQLGNLNQASGTQNLGFVGNIAGLRVVSDANIGVLYGAATNEDEVYIIRSSDMHLWEGPLAVRVLPDVGSSTLTVRLQLYGYSAFASARQPKSISIVSGAGLVTPVF